MRLLKTNFALVLLLLTAAQANAQFIKAQNEEQKSNWQYRSPQQDNVYGIDLDRAYELLKGMKPKKDVVVAIIGPGMDTGHEDLKGSVWSNKKEKNDTKDNDKNGKINDFHGWNFLGNPAGEILEESLSFGDREFLRLKDKYDHIRDDGVKLYVVSDDESSLIEIDSPADIDEYNYYVNQVRPSSPLSRSYGGIYLSKMGRYYAKVFTGELKKQFPDKTDFTREDFVEIARQQRDSLAKVAVMMIDIPFRLIPNSTWNSLTAYLENIKDFPAVQYGKLLDSYDTLIRDRILVGDDLYDIKDVNYGNNMSLAGNAGKGTSFAGIIAAQRANGIGIDGIADKARIMTLRVESAEGDWMPKDLALAIRYAVDKGADIIMLPRPYTSGAFGEQRKWVEEALSYAAAKDILIVQTTTDMALNMDNENFFPNRISASGKTLPNIITVAASDQNGNPIQEANFGSTSLDVFAPGTEIHSLHTGDTYRTVSGSDMAAAVTAGVAALIKTYYPKLTAVQLRDILINSVTDRRGVEIEKHFMIKQDGSTKAYIDLFDMDELSVSGGIVNAANAVSEAARITK